jgi:hypothetical protein
MSGGATTDEQPPALPTPRQARGAALQPHAGHVGDPGFYWMRATADHAAEMMNMLATSTRGKWERGRQQEEQPTRADGSPGAPGSSLPRRVPPAAGVRSELEGSSTTKRSYPDGESRFPLVGQPKSNEMQAPRTFFWVGCMVRTRERKS